MWARDEGGQAQSGENGLSLLGYLLITYVMVTDICLQNKIYFGMYTTVLSKFQTVRGIKYRLTNLTSMKCQNCQNSMGSSGVL